MRVLLTTHLIVFLKVISLTLTSANAVTIASWDLTDADGDEVSIDGAVIPGVRSAQLVRGPDLGRPDRENSFNSNRWSGMDEGDYIELSFVVEVGYSVALDTLFIGTRSSPAGPGTIGVFASRDGFSRPITEIAPIHEIIQVPDEVEETEVDLSGLGPIIGSFTIRLYEVGDNRADTKSNNPQTYSTGTFGVTNLSDGPTRITGTISSLPVPDGGATFALLGLGLCSLLGARRSFA